MDPVSKRPPVEAPQSASEWTPNVFGITHEPSPAELLVAMQSLANVEAYRKANPDDVDGIAERFRRLDPPLSRSLGMALHVCEMKPSSDGFCMPPLLVAWSASIRKALDWFTADQKLIPESKLERGPAAMRRLLLMLRGGHGAMRELLLLAAESPAIAAEQASAAKELALLMDGAAQDSVSADRGFQLLIKLGLHRPSTPGNNVARIIPATSEAPTARPEPTSTALHVIPVQPARAEEKPPESSLDWLKVGANDVANMRRFIDFVGGNIKWCQPMEKFLAWDGMRWCLDDMLFVQKLAVQCMAEFLERAIAAGDREAQKFARASLNYKEIREYLGVSKWFLSIHPSALDTDPMLLNFRNGTLNLATMKLQPHSREDLITRLIHYNYEPNAKCPLFLQFLNRAMGGGPDASEGALDAADRRVSWLQKAFGYSLTGNTSEKVIFLCLGVTNSGKTTLLNLFRHLVTEYASLMQVETIMAGRDSSNVQENLADLRGARFTMTSETRKDQELDEAKIKRITQGQGKITATRKYEHKIEFDETHKLWIDGNFEPKVRDDDEALWNRLCPIRFDVQIPGTEIDRKLPAKLLEEGPGILAWAAQGCRRWQEEELGRPDEILQAREAWRAHSDPSGDVLREFVNDCCEQEAGALTPVRLLWPAYVDWCNRVKVHDRDRLARDHFSARLQGLGMGFKRTDPKKHRFCGGTPEFAWEGLQLAPQVKNGQ